MKRSTDNVVVIVVSMGAAGMGLIALNRYLAHDRASALACAAGASFLAAIALTVYQKLTSSRSAMKPLWPGFPSSRLFGAGLPDGFAVHGPE